MLDLLVIGAGITGLTAAYTARQAGLSVRVIAKGLGSMHWSAGTVDVLGYLPQLAAVEIQRPLETIEQLADDHPYRHTEVDIPRALQLFQKMTAAAGIEFQARDDRLTNWRLPSPVGALRPVALAPAAQKAGNLGDGRPILVVGFAGLRDFYPRLLVENLNRQGIPARAISLPLSLLTDRRDNNPVQLAEALEQPAVQLRLGRALAAQVVSGERIGLPAILGVDDHNATLAAVQTGCGAPLFEIATLPPSVPGKRLFRALSRQLLENNVRVEAGMEAIGFHAEKGLVNWVESETSARPLRHKARTYLLATGGVLGGGFDSNARGEFSESVFDLPLNIPADRGAWFRAGFLDERGQPVFRGGVRVDYHLRPIGSDGETLFRNLWAAGGLLAGADSIRERSLEGIAIATGFAAANAIVRSLAS